MDDVLRGRGDAYRDGTHVDAAGQRIYADTLLCLARRARADAAFAPCTEPATP